MTTPGKVTEFIEAYMALDGEKGMAVLAPSFNDKPWPWCMATARCNHDKTLWQLVGMPLIESRAPDVLARSVIDTFAKICQKEHEPSTPLLDELIDVLRKRQGAPLLIEVEHSPVVFGISTVNLRFLCSPHGIVESVSLSPLLLQQASVSAVADAVLAMVNGRCLVNHFVESFWTAADQTVETLVGVCPGMCNRVKCPEMDRPEPMHVSTAVIHLNDHHKWSRERIADWLDTLDIDLTIRPKEDA